MNSKATSPSRQRFLMTLSLFSILLSLANFIYLCFSYYGLKFGLVSGKSLCNVSSAFNCDAVSISSYSQLFSVPIALWGAVTQLILLILCAIWLLGFAKDSDVFLRRIFWLSFFCVLISAVMGSISFFLLGTFCLFCIFAYVLSIATFTFHFLAQPQPPFAFFTQDILAILTKDRGFLVSLILIPLISLFANSVIQDSILEGSGEARSGMRGKISTIIADKIESWKANPEKSFDLNAGLVFKNANRSDQPIKMTIVEFADFLCPHCKYASGPVHDFVATRPGTQLIFKFFPLDGVCNDVITRKGDGLRCQLAYATHCGEKIAKKGWAVQEYIFDRQLSWSIATVGNDFKQMTQKLAIDHAQFESCIQSSETHEVVRAQAKEGSSIQGTPAFFVNGKEFTNSLLVPSLEALREHLGL